MKTDLTYWSILQNALESIKHSETKAGLMITAYGVLSTVIYLNAANIFAMVTKNPVTLVLGILSFSSGIASFYFALRCINPRFLKAGGESVIFFGIIGSKYATPQDYYEYSKGIIENKEKFNFQIAEQIHINSKIAIRKFTDVGRSIRFFVVNIGLIFVALMLELFSG